MVLEGDPETGKEYTEAEFNRIDTLEMPSDQKTASRNFVLTNIADICFNYSMLEDAGSAVGQLSVSLAESGTNSGDEDFARRLRDSLLRLHGRQIHDRADCPDSV